VLGEELFAQDPVGVVDVTFTQVVRVVILNDAAHLNIRNVKVFARYLALRFYDGLVKGPSLEVHDQSHPVGCPGLNTVDVSLFLKKGIPRRRTFGLLL